MYSNAYGDALTGIELAEVGTGVVGVGATGATVGPIRQKYGAKQGNFFSSIPFAMAQFHKQITINSPLGVIEGIPGGKLPAGGNVPPFAPFFLDLPFCLGCFLPFFGFFGPLGGPFPFLLFPFSALMLLGGKDKDKDIDIPP